MRSINGQMLKSMFISGSNNLFNHYPEIDSLNVFPVPDGDTGMNMNLTLSSGAKEIINKNDDNVFVIANSFSRGLLMGARGNSGVITSQIFRGFAKSLENKNEIKAIDLVEAFTQGKEVAYKAVMRPVEGTILTVVRESSDTLAKRVSEGDSIEKCFEILLTEAKASLARTPELLPVLKEAGVVDSGGAGFVKILEGMESAVRGIVIPKGADASASSKHEDKITHALKETYSTTLVVILGGAGKKTFVENKFATAIKNVTNSFTTKLGKDAIEINAETNNPGLLLATAQGYGEFARIEISVPDDLSKKADDVNKQIESSEPLKDFALIAVSAGKGLDELFKSAGVDYIVSGGQTMNPSTEDFVNAIKKVHAKNVFILPNNSNIVMAASQACDVAPKEINALVIPSKTIPAGLTSCIMFSPEMSVEENFNEMKAALKSVRCGSVTYSIKDTDIDGVHVTKDYYMGIMDKSIVTCVKDKFDALFNLLSQMVNEESAIITVLCGEDAKEEDLTNIENKLNDLYPDCDIDVKQGDQPVYSYLVGVE